MLAGNNLPNEVVSTNSVTNFKILIIILTDFVSFVHEKDSQADAFFPVLIIIIIVTVTYCHKLLHQLL